jgi:hypothetical protein
VASSPKTQFVWLGERRLPGRPQASVNETAPAQEAVPTAPPAPPQPIVEATPPVAPAVSHENLVESDTEVVPPRITATDLAAARRSAAASVVEAHANDDSFMTFSLDDVLEPRRAEQPKPPSIFDTRTSPHSALRVGQQRTEFGRRLVNFCNALAGGFGVSLFGLIGLDICTADSGPSGLFPEVMPEYLKKLPECEDTRPLGPLLAEQSPFPTIKCRLVHKDEPPTIPR